MFLVTGQRLLPPKLNNYILHSNLKKPPPATEENIY